MKTHLLPALILILLIGLTSCNSSPSEVASPTLVTEMTDGQLADSIRYFRKNFLQTDLLSRAVPDLSREQAIDIQLEMLDQEMAEGAKVVGWKMGGTATQNPGRFDPIYGYILDRYLVPEDSLVDSGHFPGGSILVEGEIGFVLKNDLREGISSMKALLEEIDYVVGAIELAQGTAVPPGDTTLDINYVLASGMGQVGTLVGSVKVSPKEFDFEQEKVRCYVNDALVAEGVSSNIFGNPLNALYRLANLLPRRGRYLKAGDLVITGSAYQNPNIRGAAKVRVEFSTLGSISYTSK